MRASLIFAGLLGGGAIALPQHSGDIALPQLPVPGLVRTSSTNPSPEASQPASATEASAETTQLELADKIMPETPELTFATKIIPGNFETATATQTSSETSKPEEEEEEEEEEEDSAVCSLPFKTEDEAKDSWKESGAADFLSEYLDDNGIEDWGNNMLTDTVQGGLMGTTFDCANIEGLQSCGLPEDRKCETYDPPEAYLLHISLANMMAMYHNIYETLVEEQLNVIEDKSKEIEEAFGEPEIEGIFPILIGAFVMGAAAAGPHWQIGAPLGAGIGLLNLAAGLTAQAEDTTDNLKSTMRDTYREVRKNLKTAAEAVSNGDFDGLDVDDPKQYIMDAFDEGQMIHVKQKNTSTQKYLDSFTELLNHILIFRCLGSNGWTVTIHRESYDEEFCKEVAGGTALWMKTPKDGDRCVSLIHIEKGKGNPASPTFRNKGTYLNDDDKLDKMKEYNMDLKEALQSVIDCNGGDFDFSDASKTDWDGAYPPCALPIKLEKDSD